MRPFETYLRYAVGIIVSFVSCICCGSILSLVKTLSSFVFGYCNMSETKEKKI